MENFSFQKSVNMADEISSFYTSDSQILLLYGSVLSSKYEYLSEALKKIEHGSLVFRHHCFESTTVDDFLLNFYDSFKKFAFKKRVVLKKALGDGFKNRVNSYFSNTDKKSLIVVENFEYIAENTEILSFLSHLASFNQVKIILVSSYKASSYFSNNSIDIQTLSVGANDQNAVKSKLAQAGIELSQEDEIEFYDITEGYGLYVDICISYTQFANTQIEDLIKEYKNRNMSFSDFITQKSLSLIPNTYFDFLKTLSAISHDVSLDFILAYRMGDTKQIDYLNRGLVLERKDNNFHLRQFFKEHFFSNLSVQEKIKILENLILVYNNELAKSPADRLLRLSRESIRGQIQVLEKRLPQVNKQVQVNQEKFSYVTLAKEANTPWFDKNNENKDALESEKNKINQEAPMSEEDAKILIEYRKRMIAKKEQEQKEVEHLDFAKKFQLALDFENKYEYKKAIEIFANLLSNQEDELQKIEILEHLALCCKKINHLENAIQYYNQIQEEYEKRNDSANQFKFILKVADLYRKSYRLDLARYEYEKITNSDAATQSMKIRAYIALGDIFDNENKVEQAIDMYNLANSLGMPNDDSSAQIAYKLAVLYDDIQEIDLALEFYGKNIEQEGNPYLSQSYLNVGLIYAEENKMNEAISFILKAKEIDETNGNVQGIYHAASELTKIYEIINKDYSISYAQEALDCAIILKDNYRIAFSHIELGDLHYGLSNDKDALINYFEAKVVLGENALEQNIQIVDQRINDMKVRMNVDEFNSIEAQYA